MAVCEKTLSNSWIMQCISQPCGVHKLAKSLSLGFEQQGHTAVPQHQPQSLMNTLNRTKNTEPSLPPTHSTNATENNELEESGTSPTELSSPANPVGRTSSDAANSTEVPSPTSLPNPEPTSSQTDAAVVSKIHNASQPTSTPSGNDSTRDHGPFLLVDDNNINLKILAAHLERRGIPYLTAGNGAKALEIYTSNPASCRTILMDISMPVMDGLTSTRAIRLLEKQYGLKPSIIVVLTGLASADVQNETYASGADAYLAKPVRLKELDTLLASV